MKTCYNQISTITTFCSGSICLYTRDVDDRRCMTCLSVYSSVCSEVYHLQLRAAALQRWNMTLVKWSDDCSQNILFSFVVLFCSQYKTLKLSYLCWSMQFPNATMSWNIINIFVLPMFDPRRRHCPHVKVISVLLLVI